MTPFQWLALAVLSAVLVLEASQLFRQPANWAMVLFRGSVWCCAAIAIARPALTQSLANRIGIQRGADLVIYLLALTFLATSFFLYARTVRLQRQVIALARELAMMQARAPSRAERTQGSPEV